jgi:ATP-binding cassette, subfamily B, bacterial PglK
MNLLSRIRELLSPRERRQAWTLSVLMLFGMALEMLGVGMVIPVVGLLVQGDGAAPHPMLAAALDALGHPDRTTLVVGAMAALVLIYTAKNLYLAYLYRRQAWFAYGVQAGMSQRLFSTYLQQPYLFHLQRNSAQLIRNATTESNLFASHALMPVMLLVTEGLVATGLVLLLLVFEPLGALLVGGVIGLVALGFFRYTRARILRWGGERQFHEGKRLQHLQEGLGGVKDALLLGRAAEFLARYAVHNKGSAQAARHQESLKQMPRLGLELLAIAALATLVSTMVLRGQSTASVMPILALFAATAFRLLPSVNRMLGAMQTLRYARPVVDTLYQEARLDAPADGAASMPAQGPLVLRSQMDVESVGFRYPMAAQPALHDIRLTIRRGETVGFIGTSGSGKSTLIDVILGLLPPDTGRIAVDARDIRNHLRSWQDQIGYVPQSIFLTDDSLRRNIAFGLPNEKIDEAAVQAAVRAAQLESLVASLPEGLDTPVGERGTRLSGGQRQRIGIARALYHGPSVLVLDEATSALDVGTEADVMAAITALRGQKTILIVAHRLSTVAQCDRIFRFDHGRLVAEGTPTEMLALQHSDT